MSNLLFLLHRIPETLPKEVLEAMHAPPKPDYPIITPDKLAEYDAFLLGIPTRYGNQSAQWRSFWDSTGQLWQSGALYGKYAGIFVRCLLVPERSNAYPLCTNR